jgi:hypothetical protein
MAQAIKENLEMVYRIDDSSLQGPQNLSTGNPQVYSLQVHDQPRPPKVGLPENGGTLKTDLLIKSSKIFTDAAWKTKKVPEMNSAIATGIGVYCELQENNVNTKVFIQASTPIAPSVIQAEAAALLLAAKFASLVEVQKVTFLIDNSSLAKAAAATHTSDPQVNWEIRSYVADFQLYIKPLDTTVYHINRDLNGIAHNCAHQAVRQSVSQPILSCSSSPHSNAATRTTLHVRFVYDINSQPLPHLRVRPTQLLDRPILSRTKFVHKASCVK